MNQYSPFVSFVPFCSILWFILGGDGGDVRKNGEPKVAKKENEDEPPEDTSVFPCLRGEFLPTILTQALVVDCSAFQILP